MDKIKNMKKMKRINVLLLIMVFAFIGCDDIIETKPKDFLSPDIYYSNKTELESGLTGVYAILREGALYGSHMIGRLGLDADQGYNRNSNDGNTVGDFNVSAADVKVEQFWQTLYRGINRANMLLENIDKPKDLTDKEREIIKGETLFLRAYFYFLLVTNYNDVPLILNTINTAHKGDLQVPRTPAREVYNQIIADMEKAEQLVQDITEFDHSSRITKSAVWGILSRVNLHMAGHPIQDKSRYAEAKKWSLKVIEHPIHKLNPDFTQVFINYAQDVYDIGESIWEVDFYGNGIGTYAQLGGVVGIFNGIYNTVDLELGYTYSYISCTSYTYNVYDSDDLRRDWTVAPFNYSGKPARKNYWGVNQLMNRNCAKFRREYETLTPKSTSKSPQNFPLLRYSDVLLMFAEADCEINEGPTPEAYETIDMVRRRGKGLPVNVPSPSVDIVQDLDKIGFIKEIQDERTRELAFESLRKGDLVRWGIFLENMKERLDESYEHSEFYDLRFAKRAFTSVSARDTLWPIPAHEIAINHELTQNNGW